jgi:hypothetical protein
MKSPQETLLDDNVARLRREENEKHWIALLTACKTPVWPSLMGIILWPAILVAMIAIDHSARIRPFYVFPAILFMIAFGQLVGAINKRRKAWLALINERAPELYEKLKRVGMT